MLDDVSSGMLGIGAGGGAVSTVWGGVTTSIGTVTAGKGAGGGGCEDASFSILPH
jgi:hypothetical protein